MVLRIGAFKKRLSVINRQCFVVIVIVSIFAVIIGFIVFNENYLPKKDADVDTAFEQDYALIDEATSHLLALEESSVRIKCQQKEIKGEFGEPMFFQSSEIEQIVDELAKKGYNRITKKENIVIFDVWRKFLNVEFEAGFVYSIDGSGDLSAVQFLTYQRPLSMENWYYYEVDYNEWRSNRA